MDNEYTDYMTRVRAETHVFELHICFNDYKLLENPMNLGHFYKAFR